MDGANARGSDGLILLQDQPIRGHRQLIETPVRDSAQQQLRIFQADLPLLHNLEEPPKASTT